MTMLEYEATYDNMGGKPRKRALACLAQIRKKGAQHEWLCESDDPEMAQLKLTYEGKTVTTKFTIEQAKKQNLLRPGSMWTKDPSYMLRARCITTAIGMLAPEIVAGAEAAPDEAPQVLPELTLDKDKDKHPNTQEEEEKVLAKMGLAPATKPANAGSEPANAGSEPANAGSEPANAGKEPAKPKRSGRKVIPAPGDDANEAGPIPPVKSVEPNGESTPAKSPGPPPTMEPENPDLSPEIVDQLGHLFSGNFLNVALWLIAEKWVPEPEKELQTESHAAHFLQLSLVKLSRAKAKKILTNKEAFMRAVEEFVKALKAKKEQTQ
jgi:hypothetical protein